MSQLSRQHGLLSAHRGKKKSVADPGFPRRRVGPQSLSLGQKTISPSFSAWKWKKLDWWGRVSWMPSLDLPMEMYHYFCRSIYLVYWHFSMWIPYDIQYLVFLCYRNFSLTVVGRFLGWRRRLSHRCRSRWVSDLCDDQRWMGKNRLMSYHWSCI